jgi:hypothetical protein
MMLLKWKIEWICLRKDSYLQWGAVKRNAEKRPVFVT